MFDKNKNEPKLLQNGRTRETKERIGFLNADKAKIPFIFKCPLNFLAQSARAPLHTSCSRPKTRNNLRK